MRKMFIQHQLYKWWGQRSDVTHKDVRSLNGWDAAGHYPAVRKRTWGNCPLKRSNNRDASEDACDLLFVWGEGRREG